jgi:threonine/homoserine/homoserine lactone efflux protein
VNGALSLPAAAFGIGVALASAPGPVQAVIVTEATRGGVKRGLQALLGASGAFTALLASLTMGVSISPPRGLALHLMKVAGGALLLWLAWDGLRSGDESNEPEQRRTAPPAVRGALSVALNPGAWLFLGAVAAPMLASATAAGGPRGSLLVAAALATGAAAGDGLIVLAGGLGLHRVSDQARRWAVRLLNLLLACLGVWLLLDGARALAAST